MIDQWLELLRVFLEWALLLGYLVKGLLQGGSYAGYLLLWVTLFCGFQLYSTARILPKCRKVLFAEYFVARKYLG